MSLLISRSGVAAAAHVQRPVVTMWQRRPVSRGVHVPFPEPREGHGDLFDLDEVIDWQARSGRGNNPSFAADAPGYAVTVDAGDPDDGVAALIALAALTDVDLVDTTSAELIATATRVDPQDDTLLGEVRDSAASTDLRELAARRIEAAFGHGPALDAIATTRAHAGADRSWSVTDGVIALLRDLCRSLAPEKLAVVDGGTHPSGIALRIALADAERSIEWSPSPEGPDSAAAAALRRARRRALVAGVTGNATSASVVVLQIPHRSEARASTADMLHQADELTLTLPEDGVAIVLGPASALCDALADRAALLTRADALRTGRVRAVVRLPRGLVVDKPRAELGLWVVADADRTATLADRLVVVGDVTSDTLEAGSVDGLVTDLVAAVAGLTQIRARAFAHCHPVPTARLLAADGPLVARTAQRTEPTPEAAATALTTAARLHARGLDLGLGLHTAPAPTPGRTGTIGALVAAGVARVIAGKRVAPTDLGDGSVRVIGAPEVRGDGGAPRTVDVLVAHGRYSSGLTEPGDVVVVTRPRPQALVDLDGGNLVAYPARIVRLSTGSPHAVAVTVNALPDDATALEAWPVPIPDGAGVGGLEAALRRLDERRRALQRDLAELNDLETDLVDGVTSGALVVSPNEEEE